MVDTSIQQPVTGLGSTAETNRLLGSKAFNEATGGKNTSPTVVTNANTIESDIPGTQASLAKAEAGQPGNPTVPIYNSKTGETSQVARDAVLSPDWSFQPNTSSNTTSTPKVGTSDEDIMNYLTGGKSADDLVSSDPISRAQMGLVTGLQKTQDAEYNALISQIQDTFKQRFDDLALKQKSSSAGLDQSLALGGTTRYDPTSATGVLTAKQSTDLKQMHDLQIELQNALAGAKSAKDANDYKNVQSKLDVYDKIQTKLNDKAKTMQADLKAEKDKIDQLGIDAKKNGASDADVAKITSSHSLGEAITNAGDNLRTLTGDFADYPQYKKDAQANGLVPLDASAWLEKKQATDAKNKANEAYGTAFATAKGKAAGEASASGINGESLPVTSTSGITYQVPSSVAPYVKISPSGVKYVDASGLTPAEKGKLIKDAYNGGNNPIPVITDPTFALDVSNIADATLKLKDMREAFSGVTTDSAAARDTYYAAAVKIATALETNPQAVGLDIYQDAALDILKAMSGTKGFRGGASMVQQVKDTFPTKTDTTAVVNQKIDNMMKLINDRETGLIGKPSANDQIIIDQQKNPLGLKPPSAIAPNPNKSAINPFGI